VARLSNKQLVRYITEAHAAWHGKQEELRDKFPGIDFPAFVYPYQPSEDPITPRVIEDSRTREDIWRHFKWRMTRVSYPYPKALERKSAPETIYQVVQKKKLLTLLQSQALITQIKLTWFLEDCYVLEKRVHDRNLSKHRYPLRFHRNVMKEIARHLQFLEHEASRNKIPSRWFAEYRPAVLQALLREASINYPRMIFGLESASELPPAKLTGDRQMELYQAIEAALLSANEDSANLAYHLIALVVSPVSSVRKGKLEPLPSAIGKNVRDRQSKVK